MDYFIGFLVCVCVRTLQARTRAALCFPHSDRAPGPAQRRGCVIMNQPGGQASARARRAHHIGLETVKTAVASVLCSLPRTVYSSGSHPNGQALHLQNEAVGLDALDRLPGLRDLCWGQCPTGHVQWGSCPCRGRPLLSRQCALFCLG